MVDEEEKTPEPAEDQPVDAVIVMKVTTPEGGLDTQIAVNGGVQVEGVATLLRLAVKKWERELGID